MTYDPLTLVRPLPEGDRAMSSGRTGIRFSGRPVACRMAATTAPVEEMVGGSPTPLAP
jgi:hypothetical protein